MSFFKSKAMFSDNTLSYNPFFTPMLQNKHSGGRFFKISFRGMSRETVWKCTAECPTKCSAGHPVKTDFEESSSFVFVV